MAIIVPTITTDNPEVVQANLTAFSGFCKRIQLDVSDGSFAPNASVPISSVVNMALPENVALDLHLMSARPSEHLSDILALKPSLCILHAEVDDDLVALFSELKEAGIKTGLALIKTTFPGRVKNLIELCNHVMIFAGTLGSQGGVIDMMQTEKISLIRNIKPDVELGWDGGANLSNVRALSHDGIDVINVGSAITSAADPAAMYQSLLVESEKKGVLV